MQAIFSRRAFLHLTAVACGILMMACASGGGGASAGGETKASGNKWQDQTVYTRVGMRVEPAQHGEGWHMYSTNHVGLPKHIPVGTKFTARNVGRSKLDLVADDASVIHVEFVAKHHAGMEFDAWIDRQLSLTAIALPGTLNEKERAAIGEGRYEVGMSRAALFLSIGYPPATLSPALTDPELKYELKRFNNLVFSFDAQDRISAIKN